MKIKVWFIESSAARQVILGRSAEEYLTREFAAYECVKVKCAEECVLEEGTLHAVIPLDMPLVTEEDVLRGAEYVKKHSIGVLSLGGGESCAKLVSAADGRRGYFLTSPHFVKLDGAKSAALVYNQLKERILDRLLASGVRIADVANTVVDDTAAILPGAELMPFCRIEGESVVEEGARVEGSFLKDSRVCRDAKVVMSHLVSSRVGARSEIGPFARLRGAEVGEGCRVGDFVEIKNSSFASGAKSAHLAYIGDAEVGEESNIGCGTVFCNYDGSRKHRTSVGKGCFIGANVNLVAPVRVEDGAFVAAGTTVTEDVASGAFVIGRSRQQVKPPREKQKQTSRTEKED